MPSEKEIKKSNNHLQELFYDYIDDPSKEKEKILKPLVKEFHNRQWAHGEIYNILSKDSNCYNNCKYCYMKRIKSKFFHTDIENLDMNIEQRKVDKNWKESKTNSMIMFPSSHDIFPEYLDDYIKVCQKMLKSEHKILIVTKPRKKCISKMIKEFKKNKKDLLFRLTITSDNEDIIKYYEPNASTFEERLECLKMLFNNGFKTSVSIEPYLSDPVSVVNKINSYVTDDIWIGVMSGLKENTEISDDKKEDLQKIYSVKFIKKLIKQLKKNKKIYWKTSIMKIFLKEKIKQV